VALQPYRGFVGPSYTSQSRIAAYDRTVNWYPERIESGTGAAQYALYPVNGFQTVVTGLASPGRGSLSVQGVPIGNSTSGEPYFVSGGTLYQYPSTVLATGIENVAGNPVTMATNGNGGHQILIGADTTTYYYDINSGAFASVGNGYSVDYLAGYGLRLNTFNNQFSFSGSFDFSTWDPLDVVEREDSSDHWIRLIVYHNEVWLFGGSKTSVYYLSDNPDIPFQPITSAFMQMGILAPNSACIVDSQLMWLGRGEDGEGVVFKANGYNAERISTHAVEYAIQSAQFGVTARAEGWTYQQNGHVFYALTLPSDVASGVVGSTWIYDSTEGLWSERGLWNGLQFQEMDTRGYFWGKSLSRSTGTVYAPVFDQRSAFASLDTDGVGMRRLRRAPHINQAQLRTRYTHLRLLMETGLGLGNVASTATGYDPQITLSWSDDGGQTWGSSYPISAGKVGEFSTLVDFRQLGQGRDRVFEVVVSAPVPWRLIDAFLDYSVGAS
jgi:hypothetical protein